MIIPRGPDGSKIAFVSERDGNAEIYVMNADGTNPTNITNNPGLDGWPSWSPDGSKIAFHSGDHYPIAIYVMNADGSNRMPLPFSQAVPSRAPGATTSSFCCPDWSPDANKIVYLDTDGNPIGNILVWNGGQRTQLTGSTYQDLDPVWAPDGKSIAFTSIRDGNPELYVVNADGTHIERLTNSPTIDDAPHWGPMK